MADGEIDFYEQVCYDNLDRVIRTDRRDTTVNGNLTECCRARKPDHCFRECKGDDLQRHVKRRIKKIYRGKPLSAVTLRKEVA